MFVPVLALCFGFGTALWGMWLSGGKLPNELLNLSDFDQYAAWLSLFGMGAVYGFGVSALFAMQAMRCVERIEELDRAATEVPR